MTLTLMRRWLAGTSRIASRAFMTRLSTTCCIRNGRRGCTGGLDLDFDLGLCGGHLRTQQQEQFVDRPRQIDRS